MFSPPVVVHSEASSWRAAVGEVLCPQVSWSRLCPASRPLGQRDRGCSLDAPWAAEEDGQQRRTVSVQRDTPVTSLASARERVAAASGAILRGCLSIPCAFPCRSLGLKKVPFISRGSLSQTSDAEPSQDNPPCPRFGTTGQWRARCPRREFWGRCARAESAVESQPRGYLSVQVLHTQLPFSAHR